MVTSIVLKDKYNLNVNAANKIKLGENIVSIEKDIPFVRYRFNSYTDVDFNYILATMNKFSYSTHLIEIQLNENAAQTLAYITNNIKNIAKFLYIDVTDEDVARCSLSAEVLNLFTQVSGYSIDRIMLKDKSTTLDTLSAKKIIDNLSKQSGISKDNFGVCSSPLSFGDWCCLTAVRARELMTIYSAIADVALPSANHQCMNCSGCIRYFTVESDTEVILDSKTSEKKKKSNESNSESNEKKPKATKVNKGVKVYSDYNFL